MDWKNRVISDPAVLMGKPTVEGTRLAVGFLLDIFAQGWSREEVLANENTPKSSVELLRTWGHDVVSVGEKVPGISDREVLELAAREDRVVVTFDSDYGHGCNEIELSLKYQLNL